MTLPRIGQILTLHKIEWIMQGDDIAALGVVVLPDGRIFGEWQIFTWSTTSGELFHWLGY